MIKHYITIALRNLSKQKGLAFINVFGLSVGLACFSLFLLYAVNEFSFDRFHKNADDVYRVYRWTEAMKGDEAHGDSYMPIPLGPAMKQDLPDVVNYVRMRDGWGESFIKADDKVTRLPVLYADPQMFSVFSFKFLSGNPANALQNQRNIVLSNKTALQLFGKTDVIGKTVEIKADTSFEPFTVSAVAEDAPVNSTIQFSIVASWAFMESMEHNKAQLVNWRRSGYQTYVQLKPGSNLPNEKNKLAAFRKKYYPEEEAEWRKEREWKGAGSPCSYGLQPIKQIHTDTKIGGGSVEAVSPKNIYILLMIAGAVLLIACINFTTLAIGRSANRAKEVGVRKVIGSGRTQLIYQFIAEALLLSIFSAILGALLGKFLLPFFNQLSGRDIRFSFTDYPEMLWMLAALVVLVGILAGSYPALVLSGFKPIEVLKSKVRVGGFNLFTKSLVTAQFILSIGLIISTVIILQQVHFMRTQNPGFNKENIVMVDAEGTDTKKVFPLFKQALAERPEILAVAGAELGLGEGTGFSISGFNYNGKSKDVFEYFIDNDYIKLMGIQFVAGRNFDPKITSDTVTSVIINEAMVKDFGWTNQSAIGKPLTGYSEAKTPIVIGVVKNFHFRPFSEKISSQMFHQFHDYAPYKYFVKLQAGDPTASMDVMKKAWTAAVPDLPFKYEFLDESLNRFYKEEAKWSNIVGWAGGISIFLACLGLFGLAALAAVNRTKEIGIRKVLGASVAGIVQLLSKDFLKLVFIALIIAVPLAWYFMNNWLQDFAYRINIGWWVFVVTGMLAILIALVTVSFQAIKAAIANPVKSLRTE
ncbi:MAG: ABC transporter permease [Ferruginibacter sp.]